MSIALLPGDSLLPQLRGKVRDLALGKGSGDGDTAARVADVLHLWSAFDRSWLARLLQPADPDLMLAEEPSASDSLKTNLDPRTRLGDYRLQTVWSEVIDEVVERGRRLRGADDVPFGIEELMSDVYLVAARRWPEFVHEGREPTIRWLLSVLHKVLLQALRQSASNAPPLPEDAAERTGTRLTLSRADEREAMAARLLELTSRLPAEARAADLSQRIVARPTLQLLVAADTLETALRLSPEDCRLWGAPACRQEPSDQAAKRWNLSVGALNVRFHRLRCTAINLLAECWADAPSRSES